MVEQLMDMLEDIRDVVKAERDIYLELLTIAKNKVTILVAGKVNELDKVVKAEQKFIGDIGRLEDEREKVAGKIATELDIPFKEINFTVIQEMAPQFSSQLRELQEEIKVIMEELKKVNQTNGELIAQSLDHINMTINMMAQTREDSKGTYSPQKQNNKSGFFEWKG